MKIRFAIPFFLLVVASGYFSMAQTSITLFDKVTFYNGYGAQVSDPTPPGTIRHRNDLYATKLTEEQLQTIGDTLVMHVTIHAACDNYDRIGGVNLAFVPKGANSYEPDSVPRIEIGRFITPFMNKNKKPDTVPYQFNLSNVAVILRDVQLRTQYDFWIELEVFGAPFAAREEVPGCADRNDVFGGSLTFETGGASIPEAYHFLQPLARRAKFNNYAAGASDEIGKTEKTVSFTLEEDLTDAAFILITSNHGAKAGGEEYKRREHYVYLDGNLIHQYKPGSPSCEPFRKYNTQGNGIYGPTPKTDAQWQSFSNWCPGDVIPTRRINLGPLSAGTHTFRIAVPDAQFVGKDGNFPFSLYLQGKTSGILSVARPQDSDVQIGPNPVSDFLYIRASAPVSVVVRSMDGRIVAAEEQARVVSLRHLPDGLYTVQVRDSRGMRLKTEKLLKVAGRPGI